MFSFGGIRVGKLIQILEKHDPSEVISPAIGEPHSWRGSYCELAVKEVGDAQTVGEALEVVRSAMGKTYTGYKGGDYLMTEECDIYLAAYGCCGKAITGVCDKGDGLEFMLGEID